MQQGIYNACYPQPADWAWAGHITIKAALVGMAALRCAPRAPLCECRYHTGLLVAWPQLGERSALIRL